MSDSVVPHSRPWITADDEAAVSRQVASGALARGEAVRRLEEAVAQYVGVSATLATGSGTSALLLALHGLGIQPDDEVIVPTYVCQSVADAVTAAGARVVMCDVGERWTLTADSVRAHVTARTRAIVVVHIFGITADMAELETLGIPLIEDCAQAFGALHSDGRQAGSVAAVAIFSFQATKCLTTGEGGMVATRDPDVWTRIRAAARVRGLTPSMTDLQAALGLSQFARYSEALERRRRIAALYMRELPAHVVGRASEVARNSMFFRFPADSAREFEEVRREFEAEAILVRRGVDALLHRTAGLPDESFPNAVRAFNRTVSLPILPSMHPTDSERVARVARKVWQDGSR